MDSSSRDCRTLRALRKVRSRGAAQTTPKPTDCEQSPMNLTRCDQEPIHLLGRVQGFGFLIAVTADWVVTAVSENVGAFIPSSASELLGTKADSFLSPATIHEFRNVLQHVKPGAYPETVQGVVVADVPFDVSIGISGDVIMMEFEPHVGVERVSRYVSDVQFAIKQMTALPDLEEILAHAVRFCSAFTSFDRVMAYRFLPDGSGEVVTEQAVSEMEPFLGLRYPATDIPKQARALYVRNPIRIISDSHDIGALILSEEATGNPSLDLSASVLRAVSPTHLEYLRNMGVAASASVSIIVDGKLWGLLACHHRQPLTLAISHRNALLLFGQMLSLVLESRLAQTASVYEQLSKTLLDAIEKAAALSPNIVNVLLDNAELACRILEADGMAIIVNDGVTAIHRTPTVSEIRDIGEKLNSTEPGRIFSTSDLARWLAETQGITERAAGLLAIPISSAPRDHLLFFRSEIAKQVHWAGNPEKPVEMTGADQRLSPRRSFELWKQTVRGQSKDWDATKIQAAERLRVVILDAVLRTVDETARHRRLTVERQEILIAELNHRVRNVLTLVRSLISQTNREAMSTEDYASVLEGRIQALARAHDQITRNNWSPAPFTSLVATELKEHLNGKGPRLFIHGDDALLTPSAFSTMALVMHELVANSAKHGALKTELGTVSITLARQPDASLSVLWQEAGGPPVAQPQRRGFGTTIIERSVPYELHGTAQLEFDVDGLRAQFQLPAGHVRDLPALSAKRKAAIKPLATGAGTHIEAPAHVLLVEDNMIIAIDAEDMLQQLGATSVTIASTVREALAMVASRPFDMALLDINLGTETSIPVAMALREKGIPFAFTSGYRDDNALPAALRSSMVLGKPYDKDCLQTLIGLLRGTGG